MILEPYGKTYPFEIKEQVMGLQTEPLARFMVEHYELPMSWEEYARQCLKADQPLMSKDFPQTGCIF